MPSWPSMSRLTLGAVHRVHIELPSTFLTGDYYYSDGAYMHEMLYTAIDTTSSHRPVHINLAHVYRPVPLVVHLYFQQCLHATTATPHCALVKLSQHPHTCSSIIVYNNFRSLQESPGYRTLASSQVMGVITYQPQLAYTLQLRKKTTSG